MTGASPAVAGRNSYDLYVRFGERRSFWADPDHRVALTGDRISWVEEGGERDASLHDVAEVHLQSGNVGRNTIASCRLRFADGATLLISSNDKNGLEDTARDDVFAAFVQDLHARLAALKDASIAFTAGFSETRYWIGKVIAVVATLFFLVTPTVLIFITGDWKTAWVFYPAVALLWPLYRTHVRQRATHL